MTIKGELLETLWLESKTLLPLECCGVLWRASPDSDVVDAKMSYPGPHYQDRFRFQDDWWLQALRAGRHNHQRFAGIYHSHPVSELMPSKWDVEGHPDGCMGLLLGTELGEARLFHYANSSFEECSLQII